MARMVTIFAFALFLWCGEVFAQREEFGPFLNQFPVIRVVVDKSPGNGHQSASLQLISDLRQAGYTGKLEVVIEGDVQNWKKVEVMFPVYRAEGPPSQFFDDGKLEFVTLEQFQTENRPVIELAINGASDSWYHEERLKVKTFVNVNPYGYGDSIIESGTMSQLIQNIHHVWNLHLTSPIDRGGFVQKAMDQLGEAKAHQTPLLKHLAESLPKIDLMGVYGVGYRNGAEKLRTIARALSDATKERSPSFKDSIVMLCFSKLNSRDMDFLRTSLGADVAVIDNTSQNGMIDFVIAKARIKLVMVGAVPQSVFNFFMVNGSLPSTVAGANATNLMINAAKPFISVHSSSHGMSMPTESMSHSMNLISTLLYRHYEENVFLSREDEGRAYAELKKIFINSKNPESALVQDFRKAAQEAMKRDRLTGALTVLQEFMSVREVFTLGDSLTPLAPGMTLKRTIDNPRPGRYLPEDNVVPEDLARVVSRSPMMIPEEDPPIPRPEETPVSPEARGLASMARDLARVCGRWLLGPRSE